MTQTIQRLWFGGSLGPAKRLELKAADHCRVFLDGCEVGAVFVVKSGGHVSYEYRGEALGAYGIEWLSTASSEELERRLRESVRLSDQKLRAWRIRQGRDVGRSFARAHIRARAVAQAITHHEGSNGQAAADRQRDARTRGGGSKTVAGRQPAAPVRKVQQRGTDG
jgi:hypothetical protein